MEDNAALVAMAGPARALNTTGGQVAWQAAAFGAICAGLMSMFIVGRHTRAEEESGRDELLRAAAGRPVRADDRRAARRAARERRLGGARRWRLAAYGLAVAGLARRSGVGLALTGWFFTGTALVAAQLTASTRAAYGLAGAVIGARVPAARGRGRGRSERLSWLSPIGWYQAMHAFSGLRWWPALLLLVGARSWSPWPDAVFDRRDFGSGVLPARPGPAPAGLGWPAGWAWPGGCSGRRCSAGRRAVLRAGFGTMGDDVGDLVGDSTLRAT